MDVCIHAGLVAEVNVCARVERMYVCVRRPEVKDKWLLLPVLFFLRQSLSRELEVTDLTG